MAAAFRFAFSSNAYTRRPLAEALTELARLGYAGAEILVDAPHLIPARTRPAEVAALRRVLEDCRLEVSNLNANTAHALHDTRGRPVPMEAHFEPSLTHPDAAIRRQRVAYTIRALEIAHDLGGPPVSVTTGRRTREPLAVQRERLKRTLDPVLDRAEALGVNVGIEYEPDLVIERGEDLISLIRELPHPRLGANLDLGHAWVVSDDLDAVCAGLKGRIWNCHLEDIKDRVHAHLVPGEGNLDFAAVRKALEGIGYAGFLTMELYPYADRPTYAAEKSIAFLRERFA